MVRKVDNSQFKDLGQLHWTEAKRPTETNVFNPGVLAVQPIVEMLIGEHTRLVNDQGNKTKMTVIYDAEYVMDYYMRKLVIGMGFVSPSGELDAETLETFLLDLLDYAKQMQERSRRIELVQKAKELAEHFPHLTEEQWLITLQGQAQIEKKEDVSELPETPSQESTKKRGRPSKDQA